MTDTIDSTAVAIEPAHRNLLQINDPIAVIPAAKAIAADLKREIQASGKVQLINGREYVLYEGWQTLVAMMGCTTRIVETQPLEDGGWKARAEIVTSDGRVIGAGDGMCGGKERTWGKRDEFARLSMAQVRAAQRAARISFAWVMTLGGLEATPPEELVTPEPEPPAAAELPGWAKAAANREIGTAAHGLVAILEAGGVEKPSDAAIAIGKKIRERFGGVVPVGVVRLIEDLVTMALESADTAAAPREDDKAAS